MAAAAPSPPAPSAPSPNDNLAGWIKKLDGPVTRKIAFYVLEWITKSVGEKQNEVPGQTKNETKPKEFLNFLKDGKLLNQLANFLKPNSIPNSENEPKNKEEEKENLSQFLNFAKNFGGVKEENSFNPADVLKGKGFPNLLATLLNLGGNSFDKFGKEGLSFDNIAKLLAEGAGRQFLARLPIIGKFFQPSGSAAVTG